MANSDMKILVTGGSGLLGRSIMNACKQRKWDVIGLAFSRTGPGLKKVDITNTSEVQAVLERERPDLVIHAAAERAPDKVENKYEETRNLNVTASKNLASLAQKVGSKILYISTDYVFDGSSPPYKVDDEPRPLNKYGITKLDGEKAVLASHPDAVVLRVPILYGPVERVDESAVTVLLRTVLAVDAPAAVSNYEKRYPAHTGAIADIICQLVAKCHQDPLLKGIFQWSGLEQLTKYDMCVAMAETLSLSHDHITPDNKPAPGAPRPYDSRMDNSRLQGLGISAHVPFKEGIRECLQEWLTR
ncbi:RmlD-like substrate binding domain [Trinorchestia longiramus]|nr:RmlD-like substrate binding domain [Trinorchestia longiramus]